jgi:hypothetical protein
MLAMPLSFLIRDLCMCKILAFLETKDFGGFLQGAKDGV